MNYIYMYNTYMQEGMYITLLYVEGNAYVYLSPTLPVYVHMEEGKKMQVMKISPWIKRERDAHAYTSVSSCI